METHQRGGLARPGPRSGLDSAALGPKKPLGLLGGSEASLARSLTRRERKGEVSRGGLPPSAKLAGLAAAPAPWLPLPAYLQVARGRSSLPGWLGAEGGMQAWPAAASSGGPREGATSGGLGAPPRVGKERGGDWEGGRGRLKKGWLLQQQPQRWPDPPLSPPAYWATSDPSKRVAWECGGRTMAARGGGEENTRLPAPTSPHPTPGNH